MRRRNQVTWWAIRPAMPGKPVFHREYFAFTWANVLLKQQAYRYWHVEAIKENRLSSLHKNSQSERGHPSHLSQPHDISPSDSFSSLPQVFQTKSGDQKRIQSTLKLPYQVFFLFLFIFKWEMCFPNCSPKKQGKTSYLPCRSSPTRGCFAFSHFTQQ